MVIRRKPSNANLRTPFRICLLAGIASVVLAAVVVTLTTRTVHADVLLPHTTATAISATPILSATPALLAQAKPGANSADMLHGMASWYGAVFNGRYTASGERFNMNALTACHPTLPFGSKVRVVNLANKRSVVVRITDRGDLYEGRVIDLSRAAAEKLAMTKSGLAPVTLEVLSRGNSSSRSNSSRAAQ